MLEREAKREKTLENSAREKRIKAAQKKPTSDALKPVGIQLEEIIKAAEDDFYSTIDDGSGTIREQALALAREYDAKV